jgi:hypothetical protein
MRGAARTSSLDEAEANCDKALNCESVSEESQKKKTELPQSGFRGKGHGKDARALRRAAGGNEGSANAGEISTEFCQELGTIGARKNSVT